MAYDGPDRRKNSLPDHDILMEIKGDLKHIVSWTLSHKTEDDIRHLDNIKKFDKIENALSIQQKIIWGGLGATTLIAFVIKLFIK